MSITFKKNTHTHTQKPSGCLGSVRKFSLQNLGNPGLLPRVRRALHLPGAARGLGGAGGSQITLKPFCKCFSRLS